MAGVIGSVDFGGSQDGLGGSNTSHRSILNTDDVLPYVAGDLVSEVGIYVWIAPSTTEAVYTLGLYSSPDLKVTTGRNLVWSKDITIPVGTPTGEWFTTTIPNEAVSATPGNQLGVAVSKKVSGDTTNVKNGSGSFSRSTSDSATLDSPWVEDGTATANFAVTVTTIAGTPAKTITGTPTVVRRGESITCIITNPTTLPTLANTSVTYGDVVIPVTAVTAGGGGSFIVDMSVSDNTPLPYSDAGYGLSITVG